jgi:hypothetical protein
LEPLTIVGAIGGLGAEVVLVGENHTAHGIGGAAVLANG